jgi:ATP-dependent RNA circularization protein (DNA/RNA ligase family)
MNEAFFRFPHTPHLAWLGQTAPRDDKVLLAAEASALLAADVLIEEQLDGANLGISLDADGALRCQNRGQYLHAPHAGQFARLPAWLSQHEVSLKDALKPSLILFGEWCAARHSLDYTALPDWFALFDVYDRTTGQFWSASRRDALARQAGLATVPRIGLGRFTLAQLKHRVSTATSLYRAGPLEGLVIRRDQGDWCHARAKLVRAEFTQAIESHWRHRPIEWNRVDHALVAEPRSSVYLP